MQKRIRQDCDRILRCLRDGPKTTKQVADTIRMPFLRANHLMIDLANQGLVSARHCTINATGSPINVWALRGPMIKQTCILPFEHRPVCSD